MIPSSSPPAASDKNSTPLHIMAMQSAVFFSILICSVPHATDARKTSTDRATINKTVCTFITPFNASVLLYS